MTRTPPPDGSLWAATHARDSEPLPPASRRDPVSREAEREVTQSGRRSAKCEAILEALRTGPKTSDELAAAVRTHRYSARIFDLRRQGFKILSTPLGSGRWLHTLIEDIDQ